MTKDMFDGDKEKATNACDHITGMLKAESPLSLIMSELGTVNVVFATKAQANKVVQRIIDLFNHTRLWSNNGHTSTEMDAYRPNYLQNPQHKRSIDQSKKNGQPELSIVRNERETRGGRNEPCPCGGGKKYKKWFMEKG